MENKIKNMDKKITKEKIIRLRIKTSNSIRFQEICYKHTNILLLILHIN